MMKNHDIQICFINVFSLLDGLYSIMEFNSVRPFTYSHMSSKQNYGHKNHSLAHPLESNFKEFLVLAGFQDTLVSAFGASLGWIIGHMIVLFLGLSIIWVIKNRNRIAKESGWGYPNLMDIFVIVLLTVLQYLFYVNLLYFPSTASWGLAIFWTFKNTDTIYVLSTMVGVLIAGYFGYVHYNSCG